MTGPDSDNELDAFLARRSLLNRRFGEGDGTEPPAELDRLVLAKAREAIKRPSETPVYRAPQWALPVGLAASVLLVFAVVLNFVHVTNRQSPAVAANQVPAPQVSMISELRERPLEIGSSAPMSPPLADSKAEADVAPAASLASNDARLMKRDAESARIEQRKRASAPVARADSAKTRDQSTSLTTYGSSGALAGNAAVLSRSEPATSGPATPSPEPAQLSAASDAADSPLLASNATAKPLDEAPRSAESKDTYTASTASPGSTLEESTVTGTRRMFRGGKRPAVPNTPATVAKEKAKHPNPDEWLREIDEMRAAGRIDDANRELEMFRRTYPDHSAPSPADEQRPPAQ